MSAQHCIQLASQCWVELAKDYCDNQEDASHVSVPNEPWFRAAHRVGLFPQFNSANIKMILNMQNKEIQRKATKVLFAHVLFGILLLKVSSHVPTGANLWAIKMTFFPFMPHWWNTEHIGSVIILWILFEGPLVPFAAVGPVTLSFYVTLFRCGASWDSISKQSTIAPSLIIPNVVFITTITARSMLRNLGR